MKVPFYILGLLIRYGSKSGYDLKYIIERDISDFAKIKLPTIYYHLDKLKLKGYVSSVTDKDGNRPEKQVYTITEEGKKYFEKLLKIQLTQDEEFEFSLDGILYFYDKVDNKYFLDVLKEKKKNLESKLEAIKLHEKNELSSLNEHAVFNAHCIFNHHLLHIEAEIKWISEVIQGTSK